MSSVSDLLTELAPQTTSGRGGSPVILLNGRRIAGFQEIRDLPTEAILRVDIFPEEVALKYGYRADQKVVNFVLRPRFRSLAAEAIGKVPTQGGSAMEQGKLDWLQIRRDKRLSIHTDFSNTSRLTEAERGIIAPRSNASLDGNIVTADPGLAALTGTSPSVVGIPGGLTAAPSLAQLAGSPATSTDVTPIARCNRRSGNGTPISSIRATSSTRCPPRSMPRCRRRRATAGTACPRRI